MAAVVFSGVKAAAEPSVDARQACRCVAASRRRQCRRGDRRAYVVKRRPIIDRVITDELIGGEENAVAVN